MTNLTIDAPSVPDRQHRHASAASHDQNVGEVERAASVALGAALVLNAVRRPSLPTAVLSLLGGALVYRGVSGYCPAYKALGTEPEDATAGSHPLNRPISIERTIAIQRSPQDIYAFMHEASNMPKFMQHVESVTERDGKWHWVVSGPGGVRYTWESRLVEDSPGKRIAWQSEPGAAMPNSGAIDLDDLGDNHGTLLRLQMRYVPPMGIFGEAIGRISGHSPWDNANHYLHLLRQLLEAGELATIRGQPHGD